MTTNPGGAYEIQVYEAGEHPLCAGLPEQGIPRETYATSSSTPRVALFNACPHWELLFVAGVQYDMATGENSESEDGPTKQG